HEMKVGVVNALAREIAENIRDAIVRIPGLQPPDRFQPPPEIRAVESRLTAEQAELQAKIGRTYSREMLGNDALQNRGIGRRAGDCRHVEIHDLLDEKFRAANAKRNDERPCRFKRHVIAKATHPHLVVEAM